MKLNSTFLLALFLGLTAQALSFDCNSYWLWAGVKKIPSDACSVYLHQGHWQLSSGQQPFLTTLGMAPHLADMRDLHLVYRLETLSSPHLLANHIIQRIERWEEKQITISGVQLDFDAGTYRLTQYIEFLKKFRRQLPEKFLLSITGLADWAPNAPLTNLKLLKGVVDHIDFQMYQGNAAVRNWEQYAGNLDTLPVSFRLGLLPDMAPSEELLTSLKANKNYRGTIRFLNKKSKIR